MARAGTILPRWTGRTRGWPAIGTNGRAADSSFGGATWAAAPAAAAAETARGATTRTKQEEEKQLHSGTNTENLSSQLTNQWLDNLVFVAVVELEDLLWRGIKNRFIVLLLNLVVDLVLFVLQVVVADER